MLDSVILVHKTHSCGSLYFAKYQSDCTVSVLYIIEPSVCTAVSRGSSHVTRCSGKNFVRQQYGRTVYHTLQKLLHQSKQFCAVYGNCMYCTYYCQKILPTNHLPRDELLLTAVPGKKQHIVKSISASPRSVS